MLCVAALGRAEGNGVVIRGRRCEDQTFSDRQLKPALTSINLNVPTPLMLAPDNVSYEGYDMFRLNFSRRRERECSASLVIAPAACINSPVVLAVVLLVGISVQARADDPHLGIIEYEISCMACHGVDGHGDGRLAHSLKTAPADLTLIAKSNGGEFPFAKVADIIDGRAIVAAHGQREMPVWGDRYRRAIDANEPPAAIEQRTQAQIAALARYIESIQAK